jgi:hypothetical protein
MKIDSTHRPWIFTCAAVSVLGAVLYIPHAHSSIGAPSGRSVLGLVFGTAGYGLMVYAALLGVRKKFPLYRAGRASTWMRGHLWLGLLSFPMLLFHSGFAAKGPLTACLMVLLILTIATGVLGALIQHFLPTLMTRLVPLETIYEQIPNIRERLRAEADEMVSHVLEPAGVRGFVWGARPPGSEGVATVDLDIEPWTRLQEIYSDTIRPFLLEPDQVQNECADKERSVALFAALRIRMPASVQAVVTDLEEICEEHRQLRRQKVVYQVLHAWLLVHVPASLALLVLGGIHAAVSLWY